MKTLQKHERFLHMKRFAILIALSILQTHFVQAQQPRPDVAVRTILSNLKNTFTEATDNSPFKTFFNTLAATALSLFKSGNEIVCSRAAIKGEEKEQGYGPYIKRGLAGVTVGGLAGFLPKRVSIPVTFFVLLEYLYSETRLKETGDFEKYRAGSLLFGGALPGLIISSIK